MAHSDELANLASLVYAIGPDTRPTPSRFPTETLTVLDPDSEEHWHDRDPEEHWHDPDSEDTGLKAPRHKLRPSQMLPRQWDRRLRTVATPLPHSQPPDTVPR